MHPSPQKIIASLGTAHWKSTPRCQGEEGFTLVEMLLSMAILAMLVVMVSQMVGSVSSGTAASGKRISADDEARMVFDRMAGDFAGMITRPDVDPSWAPSAGNDRFFFYSQAPASFTNSTNSQIAYIGYRVITNGVGIGLCRYGVGLGWDDLNFINGPVTTPTVLVSNTIAPSVLRMEYALLMKPGSTNNSGTLYGAGVYSQTNNPGQSMQDVAGIVVGLVILDQASQKISTTNGLNNMRNTTYFSDATITGIPIGSWLTKAQTIPTTGAASIPKAARAQIRVYQRYFPLNR